MVSYKLCKLATCKMKMKEKIRMTQKPKMKMKEKIRMAWIKIIKRIIPRRILIYRKSILFYSKISIIVIVEIIIILVFYLSDKLCITKEMLYWLFSATSQSMAALFAIVGMFAVFRHQNLEHKLRNLYDTVKFKFSSGMNRASFGAMPPEGWEDSSIVNKAEDYLEMKENKVPKNLEFGLRFSLLDIKFNERARNEVLVRAKIPLATVLITFIFSIIFIPLVESISKNIFGIIILLVMLALITFSMINLFYYLIYSISQKKRSN